jgi:NDP-sugar pyrophosphorylase family protein
MRALILAAGFGTRLLPLTRNIPKPMFPVVNKPILEHCIGLLSSHNIRDIAINLHHLPDKVSDHFGSGENFGVRLTYSREKTILGTAGGIKALQHFLDGDSFIVMNGDIFMDIDLNQVIEFHARNKACLTLVLRPATNKPDPIEVDANGRVTCFKGASINNITQVTSHVTFTGLQIMEPEIFKRIPENRFCGTTDEIFPAMIKDGLPVYGYTHQGYWNDMGNQKDYLQLHRDIFDGKILFENRQSFQTTQGPLIIPPVYIGKNCQISGNAQVGPYVSLGDRCRLKHGAIVENSVIWNDVEIGVDATARNSVISHGVTIEDRQEVFDELKGNQ